MGSPESMGLVNSASRARDYGTRLYYGPASLRTGCPYAGGIWDLDWFESLALQQNKTSELKKFGRFCVGGDYGTRTCDLLRVKQAL